MRCSSCGTENAADSRFCGGCGARLGGSRPRVAPTQKIADDASFPQPPPPAAAGVIPLARPYPASAPPIGPGRPLDPPGVPPRAAPERYSSPAPGRSPRAASELPRAAARDTPSLPIAARRPWPLIAVVLLVDLGLAVAGAWLLSEGLGARPAANRAAPARAASGSP